MKKMFLTIALGSAALLAADDQNARNREASQKYYDQRQRTQQYDQSRDYQNQRLQQYNQNQQYQQQRNQQYQNQQYQQHKKDLSYEDQPNQTYQQRNPQADYDNNNETQYVDHKRAYGDNQGAYSDQEINKEIHNILSSGWFSKGFQNVSYDVNNGNVTLNGSVDSIENKNKVEEKVKKIDGVRQISNNLKIAKESSDAYSESQLRDSEKKYPQDSASSSQDRQLNARIRDKLSNGWLWNGYETLVIRTDNGVVIINGMVEKPEEIQKINDQVKNVEGVKSIKNQLNVKNR